MSRIESRGRTVCCVVAVEFGCVVCCAVFVELDCVCCVVCVGCEDEAVVTCDDD